MDSAPNPSPISPAPQSAPTLLELQESLRYLRLAVNAITLLLLILTMGLNIFLYRQVGMARRQVSDASEYLNNFQQTTQPMIDKFINQLQTFARTNPDFAPILNKYIKPAEIANIPKPPGAK